MKKNICVNPCKSVAKYFLFLLCVLCILSVLCVESPLYCQSVTVKQHKHLYFLAVTIPTLIVAENQWKYYDKNRNIYSEMRDYRLRLEKGGMISIPDIGFLTGDDFKKYLKDLQKLEEPYINRCHKYLWYLGASAAVSAGSFIYAVIPVKVKIPVDLSVHPEGIELTYNF